jgi:hypothetical protein
MSYLFVEFDTKDRLELVSLRSFSVGLMGGDTTTMFGSGGVVTTGGSFLMVFCGLKRIASSTLIMVNAFIKRVDARMLLNVASILAYPNIANIPTTIIIIIPTAKISNFWERGYHRMAPSLGHFKFFINFHRFFNKKINIVITPNPLM